MTFNAGSAMVTLDGDSTGAVDAFKRASEAGSTFESRAKGVADAVMRTTSRVDELRAKQAALASALVAAAAATERDEGKVHALRLELEQTTGTLNRLTGAQQVSVSVQQKIATATSTAATSHRNMGGAVLEASRAFEDMQYGIAGVLNNIPALVMGLGGTMGLAGVLSLVLVGATQVTKLWPDFGAAAKTAIATAAEDAKTLRGEITGLEQDLIRLRLGGDRAALYIQGQAVVAAAEAAAPGLEKVGGRERFDRLVGYEAKGTSIDSVNSMPALEWEALKAAVALADLELSKLAAIKRIQNEKVDQEQADAAIDAANAAEAAYQASQKAAAAAAEMDLTKSQEYDAVAALFADVNGAGTKSTASWANPTITPEGANELAGMQSEAERAIVVISDAADATADEIAKMNADFLAAGEVVAALRTPLERFVDGLKDALDAVATDAAGAAAGGDFSGAGSMLGSAAGTVAGNVVAPGIGGAIGGGLGSALGGMAGGLMEKLMESLGVLTPVFDALGVVVSALSPIFMVLAPLFEVVGQVLLALTPIIVQLAEPIAAIALYLIRFIQILMPFINIFLLGISILMGFFDIVTMGTSWLDEHFFRPLIGAVAWVYNGFIDFYNGIINFIRGIEIAGKKPFEHFGVLAEHMKTATEDIIGSFPTDSIEELGGVLDGTTDEADKLGRSMSNVPSWYREPLAEYRAAGGSGGQGGSGGTSASSAPGGNIFNGPVTFVMQSGDVASTVRKALMKQRGMVVGGVRRSNDDDSN